MQESCQLLGGSALKNYLRLQQVIILAVKAGRVILRKNYQTDKNAWGGRQKIDGGGKENCGRKIAT